MKLLDLFRKKEPVIINQVKPIVPAKPKIIKPAKYEVKFITARDFELTKLTDEINQLLLKGWTITGSSIYRNKILITLTHII